MLRVTMSSVKRLTCRSRHHFSRGIEAHRPVCLSQCSHTLTGSTKLSLESVCHFSSKKTALGSGSSSACSTGKTSLSSFAEFSSSSCSTKTTETTVAKQSSEKSNKKKRSEIENVKTAILLMNMGGPSSKEEVQPFLTRLFTDTDIMQLPFQSKLGAWIAQRRAPSVAKKYDEIGGGSPILEWTKKQGSLLTDLLNERNVSSAPHKYYIAFRYTHPLLDATLQDISRDGVERVVVFPQYPQYSCSTTGSSLNQLAAFLSTNKLSAAANDNLKKVSWSVIDRWSLNSGLIDSIVDLIQKEMKNKLDSSMDPSKVMLLFSAHSLPLYVVERGDTYTTEVASTVMAVMSRLQYKYPFRLVWQSKVGPLKWMSPYTDKTIKAYAGKGIKNFVVVPIAFVNEHIETLHELDIEYGEDLRKELKLENIIRVPTPNVHPAFIEGLHQEVSRHLSSQDVCSAQLKVTCPHCTNPSCSQMRKWLEGLSKRHQ